MLRGGIDVNKIPKVIHYCWFGKGEKPKLAKKCIKSWKKYLPDYEIIEWNEENFDINSNQYVKEAYESKKYAFVSDYVRLYALCNYGGIYMDTDVEVIKSLDEFLVHDAFSGFESLQDAMTGIMGCKKNFNLFKEFLDYYTDRSFIKENEELDTTTNVRIMNNILNKCGLISNNELQTVNGLTIYPKTYFCPLSFNSIESEFSNNTYTIHHFSGSWMTKEEKKVMHNMKKYSKRKKFLCKFLSERNAYIILDIKWILRGKVEKLFCKEVKS